MYCRDCQRFVRAEDVYCDGAYCPQCGQRVQASFCDGKCDYCDDARAQRHIARLRASRNRQTTGKE